MNGHDTVGTGGRVRPRILGETAAAVMAAAGRRELAAGGDILYDPKPLDGRLGRLSLPAIHELAAARTAVRDFSARAIDPADLLEICAEAAGTGLLPEGDPFAKASRARWPVLARNVAGRDPSICEYGSGELRRCGPLPDIDVLRYSVEPHLVSAPCIINPVWDLGGVLSVSGTDGYLNLLIDAGSRLYRAWLVAVSIGLAGCIFRSVHPALLRSTLGTGSPDSWSCLALAVGYPA